MTIEQGKYVIAFATIVQVAHGAMNTDTRAQVNVTSKIQLLHVYI